MHRDSAIYLLALGQTLAWATIYYVFPALMLRWEQDLGWSKVELTAAITIAILVSAAASPMTGRIIDRGYGATLVGTSALIGGIGLILLSFVVEQWQFYAGYRTASLRLNISCIGLFRKATKNIVKFGALKNESDSAHSSEVCIFGHRPVTRNKSDQYLRYSTKPDLLKFKRLSISNFIFIQCCPVGFTFPDYPDKSISPMACKRSGFDSPWLHRFSFHPLFSISY